MSANNNFLFDKKNYYFMAGGLFLIALGFFLMTGHDANTMPDGNYNADYWNEDIFSWRRIRLAPFLVLAGFGLNIFAIMKNFRATPQ